MPLPRLPWRTFAHPVSVTAAVVLAHAGVLWALHNAWAPPATAPPDAVKVVVELRAQAPGAPPAAPAAEVSSAPPRASAPAATAARASPERATRPEPPAPAAPLRPSAPLPLPPASPNPSPALAAEPVQPLALALPVAAEQAPAGAEASPRSGALSATQSIAQGIAPPGSATHGGSSGAEASDTAHAAAGRAPSGQTAAPAQIVPPSSSGAHLHNPAPPYPVLSRRLGEQGRVLLRVRIEADGSASAAQVYGSSGFARLDQAARQAVLRWRFVPGTRNGEPQAMWHLVPIHFVLE